MLDALDDFVLPLVPPPGPPQPPLPTPGVSIVSVAERTVGLGNRRGTNAVGPFAVLALKGVRLDAVVRYQYWAGDPAGADALISGLQTRLGTADEQLRALGFLRIAGEGTSLAENIATLNAWRKTADYRVLYEFRYQDADGAESLIARIPIDINSEFNESTSVSDEMIRWDNLRAPVLSVRRGRHSVLQVGALNILAFLPAGWNGNAVTLTASVNGTVTQQIFASVRDFLNAFELETQVVELGGAPYREGRIVFPNPNFPAPIILRTDQDFFRITYSSPSFDSQAVVYLRVVS